MRTALAILGALAIATPASAQTNVRQVAVYGAQPAQTTTLVAIPGHTIGPEWQRWLNQDLSVQYHGNVSLDTNTRDARAACFNVTACAWSPLCPVDAPCTSADGTPGMFVAADRSQPEYERDTLFYEYGCLGPCFNSIGAGMGDLARRDRGRFRFIETEERVRLNEVGVEFRTPKDPGYHLRELDVWNGGTRVGPPLEGLNEHGPTFTHVFDDPRPSGMGRDQPGARDRVCDQHRRA